MEVPQEGLGARGDPPTLVGYGPAPVADPDIPAVLVPSLRLRGVMGLGIGMEDPDNDVLRGREGIRVPANDVQEELATGVPVPNQSIQLGIAGDAVAAEIAPFVAL
mmetsp:Transcript_4426/g.11430  ORF Transcript_4426/g.11430 Transcript_4426/m.11430 type:complete len:106 (+) Transcript_4426:772-1089(+)